MLYLLVAFSLSLNFIECRPQAAASASAASSVAPSASGQSTTKATTGLKNVVMKTADDSNADWKTLTCADPAVVDATINPKTRWTNLKVNDAWDAAVSASKTAKNGAGVTWPQLISNFFHGPDNMGCAALSAKNGCNQDILCEGPPKSYVPSFEILNSFIGISSVCHPGFTCLVKRSLF